MTLETFSADAARQQALLDAWKACGGGALQQRGSFSIALSAQPTALACLRQLSRGEWPWSATHLYLADENWVPRAHAQSHYRQIFEACRPRPVNLHGWETENLDPDLAAHRFEKHLIQQLGKPPQFDLAILEAGPQGRVAALYPDCPALLAEQAFALDQQVPERHVHQLTLTLNSYLRARELWLVTRASEHKYWEKDAHSPAGRLLAQARNVTIFLLED
jgi:6-phosphogluconolactonase/glucosamine-6-phosphate isomerase/deaminase